MHTINRNLFLEYDLYNGGKLTPTSFADKSKAQSQADCLNAIDLKTAVDYFAALAAKPLPFVHGKIKAGFNLGLADLQRFTQAYALLAGINELYATNVYYILDTYVMHSTGFFKIDTAPQTYQVAFRAFLQAVNDYYIMYTPYLTDTLQPTQKAQAALFNLINQPQTTPAMREYLAR